MQENKDCPICGQKGVLIFVPSKPYTQVHGPSRDSSGSRIIGNATPEMTTSYWNVTEHAKICSELFYIKDISDRKHLLEYHLGQTNVFEGDIYDMSSYEKALSEANFCFGHDSVKGECIIFILHKHNKLKRYMETKAKTLSQAKEKIRQKLLKGEGVILENGDAYQMVRSQNVEALQEKDEDLFGVEKVLRKIANQTKFTFEKVATRNPS